MLKWNVTYRQLDETRKLTCEITTEDDGTEQEAMEWMEIKLYNDGQDNTEVLRAELIK